MNEGTRGNDDVSRFLARGDYDDFIIAKHDALPLHELQAAVCQGSGEERNDDDDDDTPGGRGVWWGVALL